MDIQPNHTNINFSQTRTDMKAEDFIRKYTNADEVGKLSSFNQVGLINAMDAYAESKLQSLKEEVEKLPTRQPITFSDPIERKWVEREKVLNLITNLEDNG